MSSDDGGRVGLKARPTLIFFAWFFRDYLVFNTRKMNLRLRTGSYSLLMNNL